MWMWRYGRTFPRRISVDQGVELHKKRVQESRSRGAETLRRRRDAAWAKGASARQSMTLGECYIVYDIEPDILTFDIERFIFDIKRESCLRYRLRYQSTISNDYVRYRRDETSISTVLFITFDIDGMSPLMS
jgi:hypothetical protein